MSGFQLTAPSFLVARQLNRRVLRATIALLTILISIVQQARAQCQYEWLPLGAGLAGTPNALAVVNDDLFAGGELSGSVVKRWNGQVWQSLAQPLNGSILAMSSLGGNLVVAGGFDYNNWPWGYLRNVAWWDGSVWRNLGGVTATARAIFPSFNGRLILGGDFTQTWDGHTVNEVGYWVSPYWWPQMGNGLSGSAGGAGVAALSIYDGRLFAGGGFTSSTSPNVPISGIAQLVGSNWQSVGGGISGPGLWYVRSLTVYSGELIAGGGFTSAGGASCNYIAAWNGTNWHSLGSGMNGHVFSLMVYNNELIAAGGFTSAGGVPCNRIARWNGSSWQPLGSGMNSWVSALTVYKGDLIAAGSFTTAGNLQVNGIARWAPYSTIDSDCDGLLDDWEVNGIPYLTSIGTEARYQLPGAMPFRKDLYVEADAMVNRGPSQSAIQRVVDAFGRAPVAGSPPGIALHVLGEKGMGVDDVIPGAPRDYPSTWVEFGQDKTNYFGTATDRINPEWPFGMKQAKAKAFRYCIFANTYGGKSSSGLAEGILCNDFMITLGALRPVGSPVFPDNAGNPGGTDDDRIGTFMHELGHALGLRHGGYDDINWKPNYYSVMNYWWQKPYGGFNRGGSSGTWQLRYSTVGDYTTAPLIPQLNEARLDEATGVSMSLVGRRIPFSVPSGTGQCPSGATMFCNSTAQNVPCTRFASIGPSRPVNWDDIGGISSQLVGANINAFPNDCPDLTGMAQNQVLSGFDDWARLQYAFTSSPYYADGAPAGDTGKEVDIEINDFISVLPPSFTPPGDTNCDGQVNGLDVRPFITAIMSPSNYAIAFPNCDSLNADMNGDGFANQADVSQFVSALLD